MARGRRTRTAAAPPPPEESDDDANNNVDTNDNDNEQPAPAAAQEDEEGEPQNNNNVDESMVNDGMEEDDDDEDDDAARDANDNHSEPQHPQPPSSSTEDESLMKILLSTDNHLGYLERDPIRSNDSFAAFEEVLSLARLHKVDLVLLSGDLFHDNKPSRKTLHTVRSRSYVRYIYCRFVKCVCAFICMFCVMRGMVC